MLYAMLAACFTLILVLAVPRAARASRLARLLRAQEVWAEAMDRKTQPNRQCPLAPPWRGPRDGDDGRVRPQRFGPRYIDRRGTDRPSQRGGRSRGAERPTRSRNRELAP